MVVCGEAGLEGVGASTGDGTKGKRSGGKTHATLTRAR